MNSLNSAIQLAIFTANAHDIAAFLSVAIDSITNARHEWNEHEKSGFCLCIAALKQNICGAHEADMRILETEGGHV